MAAVLVVAIAGSGCASEDYALPAPIAPKHYDLARQRDWICRHEATRKDINVWGIVLTSVGSAVVASGAAWMGARAANDRSVTVAPVVLTAGGAALFGGGAFLLHDSARRATEVEDARADYANDLEHANLDSIANSGCSAIAPPKPDAAARAERAATRAEQAAAKADEAAQRASTAASRTSAPEPPALPQTAAATAPQATDAPDAKPATEAGPQK